MKTETKSNSNQAIKAANRRRTLPMTRTGELDRRCTYKCTTADMYSDYWFTRNEELTVRVMRQTGDALKLLIISGDYEGITALATVGDLSK